MTNGDHPPEASPPREERVQIPDELPVLPLRATTVFPFAIVPLVVGQERSVQVIDEVMRGDRMLALVTQKNEVGEPGPGDLFQVGSVGIVQQLFRAQDGTLRLLVQGIERVQVREFTQTTPILRASIEPLVEEGPPSAETEGLRRAVLDVVRELASVVEGMPPETTQVTEGTTDPRELLSLVATSFPIAPSTKQEILEIVSIDAQLRRLLDALQHELAVRQLGRKIASETEQRLSRAQREAILREQMRSIQQELGEEAEGSDIEGLRRAIEDANMTEEARKEAERELQRLASIPAASPEHGMIRNYLEWMTSLPWNKLSGSAIDMEHARQVLDADHYDLERVKERILEHLAVQKLRAERQVGTGEVDGSRQSEPILCFVGPPGVGKTSLGRSIARALGREFIRISLGGTRDEAEIRGHRRTYIGALPGRIIQGLRRTPTRDPVFMLDEIDKVGSDWRGDPSSALLEVLDPAQNQSFNDNYLGVGFDLSSVFFITTANTLETIPPPLLDRMETIQIAGYTEDEKLHIARDYLIPDQLKGHALRPEEVLFDDAAVRRVIRQYTREAGVRNLNREIATVIRKAARAIVEGAETPITIGADLIEQYLRRPRFTEEALERVTRPGVVTGLAWTPVGGDILFIEATMMPAAEERLIITGQLGEVMRESAQAALSVVRADAKTWGIDPAVFEKKVIHLHVPAGAVPKDGPSAGIAMFTALASLASGRGVRNDVAMTGEITLRGRVLPIGGVKEKVLAAHRAGVKTVILPRRNEGDIDDVPAELREELHFVLVDTAEEVLRAALSPDSGPGEALTTPT
jgi:ATP-dependent Lon protease